MASTHQTLFVTNYSMREKAQAVTASLRDFPLTWRDMPIHMHWRWKWLESYNNCTFSTGKGKCLFNLLSWIPNSFCTFHDYVRQTIPPLHSHWRNVTDFSSFALKNRVCACPEKQSLPWKFSLYTFHIQDFWATCACPEKQSVFELVLNIYFLSFRIWNNLRLPWKTVCPEFTVLNINFYHTEFWTTCACPE